MFVYSFILLNNNIFFQKILYILASAGTYIKEFVHGDLERTIPNVGTLLNSEADIIQLDVFKLYEKLNEDSIKDFLEISCPPEELLLK